MIGEMLGPYQILAELGRGGMGEVYRARDTKLNRDVAIKVLPGTVADDPERLARFEREAQVLALLNHPNIAAIYGLESRAIVMELVDGSTLEELMAGPSPIDRADALAMAPQIAEALEAAHDQGIVHRDLKPANVKVTAGGSGRSARIFCVTCVAALVVASGSSSSRAAPESFRALRETRPVDPTVNQLPFQADASSVAPRVLVAGDSWAQYMWDDGSHNDIFDKFGHGDKRAFSLSLADDPGPGYTGPEFAISGSEARQWADTVHYPWIANMVAALEANPTIDTVLLSIGGNDLLAGKSDDGWYKDKDMDLDVPGSEAALFARLEQDTFVIIEAALAVRPTLRVMLSSYDYPNFNVGLLCFVSACPMRRNLSRDPTNDLISDAEINAMLVQVESLRIGWANTDARILFDHSLGLMHYYYGDGVSPPGALAHPGQIPPAYAPFPGGNALRPSLRSCFRRPGGLDVDPIHLDYEGYQYKITNETQARFYPEFRGDVTESFLSAGGAQDGWTDGSVWGTDGVRVGRVNAARVFGIMSFDTAAIPEGATFTGAALYLHRQSAQGSNPFQSGALGLPQVDVAHGSFGSPEVEAADASAAATVANAGAIFGSARANGYAVRIEIDPAAFGAIHTGGTTQFRLCFATPGTGSGTDHVVFADGDVSVSARGWVKPLALRRSLQEACGLPQAGAFACSHITSGGGTEIEKGPSRVMRASPARSSGDFSRRPNPSPSGDGRFSSPIAATLPTLSHLLGTGAPVLDVAYEMPVAVEDPESGLAATLLLRSGPNPFGRSTTLRFALPRAGEATLCIYDVAGRRIATLVDGMLPAGAHGLVWDGQTRSGRRVPTGVYWARLLWNGYVRSERLVHLEP